MPGFLELHIMQNVVVGIAGRKFVNYSMTKSITHVSAIQAIVKIPLVEALLKL